MMSKKTEVMPAQVFYIAADMASAEVPERWSSRCFRVPVGFLRSPFLSPTALSEVSRFAS